MSVLAQKRHTVLSAAVLLLTAMSCGNRGGDGTPSFKQPEPASPAKEATASDFTEFIPFAIDSIPFETDIQTVRRIYGIKNLQDVGDGEFETTELGRKVKFNFSEDKLKKVTIAYDTSGASGWRYRALEEKISLLCDYRIAQVSVHSHGYYGTSWDYKSGLYIGLLEDWREEEFIVVIMPGNANIATGYKNIAWGASIQTVREEYGNITEEEDKECASIGVKAYCIDETDKDEDGNRFGNSGKCFYFFGEKLYQINDWWTGGGSGVSAWSLYDPGIEERLRRPGRHPED